MLSATQLPRLDTAQTGPGMVNALHIKTSGNTCTGTCFLFYQNLENCLPVQSLYVHICFDALLICSKSRQNNHFRSVEYGLVSDPNLDLVTIYIYQKTSTHIVRVTKDCPLQWQCHVLCVLLHFKWEVNQD